jgi:hypothetical protein
LKQEWTHPKCASEALEQIQNFLALLYFIFGERAKVSLAVNRWISHIQRNKAVYDSIQRTDPTFLIQLLYSIDMAVQVHLNSCLIQEERSDVDDDCLDFKQDMTNIQRRQFSCTLPNALRLMANPIPDDKHIEGNGGGGGGGGGDAKRKREQEHILREQLELEKHLNPNLESKKIKNANPNKAWLLKENENFGQVFYSQIKACPKQGRRLVCLRYWIKGECFKNCKHVHTDIDEPTKKSVDDWIKKCRVDFQ